MVTTVLTYSHAPMEYHLARPGSFLPSAGNPMRPALIYVAILFPAMMIGFPAYVHFTGGPVGQTIAIVIMLGVVGLICVGITAWSAHAIEMERRQLWSSEVWAVWHVPEDEYRRFIGEHRRKELRITFWMTAAVAGLLLLLYVGSGDLEAVAVLGAVVAVTTVLLVAWSLWPPGSGDSAREVRIGSKAVEALGSYHQLRGRGHILDAVYLQTEPPAQLVFRVWGEHQAGNRRRQILHIPVPADRIEEARDIVERFAPSPPANETYPELLRRKRAERELLLREETG
jgi:hypothetical protein